MAKINKQIEQIIQEATAEAEKIIKIAVRQRMTQTPKPGGFLFAMGSAFWIRDDGETAEYEEIPRTKDIQDACDEFLDTFGSMDWRIDYVDGKLVERTDW